MTSSTPPRYSLRRASETLYELLDSKHGDVVAAKVFLAKTVDGSGWKLGPLTTSRTMSRKLHASPAEAIASMNYMTKRAAEDAVAALLKG